MCKVLDHGLTPKNIKSDFAATAILPGNQKAFSDSDFVRIDQSDQHQMATSFEHSLTEVDKQSVCVVTSQLRVAANEKMLTSESSTSITP